MDERVGTEVGELERRARMHAALGEPVRLRIVDDLVLGDLSPGELGVRTGLPTNLLAHHLRVLEDAGVVRRVRSEGDRRRSYVQLRWDSADVAAMLGAAVGRADVEAPPRVVFVCTRNSARSQLAAAAWRRVSGIPVASAGTRPAERVHPRAVAAGRRHGLTLDRRRPRRIVDVVRPGDLVVAVCDGAHEELGIERQLHWAVPDPVRRDADEAFDAVCLDLHHRVERLARTVAAQSPPSPSTR